MSSVSEIILLLNAGARHERERRKNPLLAAAVVSGGHVVKQGMLSKAVLPLVDGSSVAYLAHPAGWKFVKSSHNNAKVTDVNAVAA